MLFNSFLFLAFFAIIAVVYYLLPHRFRWVLLVLASIYFYATFEITFTFLLIAVTLVSYGLALAMQGSDEPRKKKLILVVGVILSLAPLVIFKYFDFIADSVDDLVTGVAPFPQPLQFAPRLGLLLPVGLSFYTFSVVSYLADVYWGKLPAERHLGHYGLYVTFFPKLLAGPIERATHFLPQLLKPVQFSSENVTQGLQLILWGLFKKVVIADRLAVFVDAAYSTPNTAPPGDLLLATFFFAFQIYCDFSGYTDMAIGCARVLGLDLSLNFRRPYLSTSVAEFWGRDRWHISLNTWFRDYMYFPMGGSRVPPLRRYFNLMAVFVVSGLWHGAAWTFVIWGALNGVYLVISSIFHGTGDKIRDGLRLPLWLGSILAAVITFLLILVTWVFFRAESVQDAVTVFTRVASGYGSLWNTISIRLSEAPVQFAFAMIILLMTIEIIDEKTSFWTNLRVKPRVMRWAVYYGLILLLLVGGSWALREFVYMQF